MSKKWVLTLSKALCVFFSFVFGIVTWAKWLAFENKPWVTSLLGQSMYEITATGDGKVIDPLTGVNNPDYKWYYAPQHSTIAALEEEADAVCEQVEAEGAALLYNKFDTYDGEQTTALPIKANSKVSMFSTGAIRPHYAGQGSHGVGDYTKNNNYVVAFSAAGHTVNQVLWDRYTTMHGNPGSTSGDTSNKYRRNRNSYATDYKLGDIPWTDLYESADQTVKDSIEEYGDAAIFCITRQGGEGVDLWPGTYGSKYKGQGDGTDMLKLNSNERSVLVGLTTLKKQGKIKRIIINLNTSNSVGVEFINDPDIDVDAVVWTGGYGERGIYAFPKLLDGTVNFSGSMPFSVYYDNWDIPAVSNFYNSVEAGNVIGSMMNYTNLSDLSKKQDQYTTTYVVYKEGIYVDYRYHETRYEDVVLGRENVGTFNYADTIAYTFGTSLSYTEFEYSNLKVEAIKGSNDLNVSVTVKNVGSKSGKKAVQFYAQKPYTDYDVQNGVEKSAVDMVGFAKTEILAPGASQTVTTTVYGRDVFAAYDSNGAKTYVVTPGDYYITAGMNAHDAVNNILAAKGKTTANGMDYDGKKELTWKKSIGSLDKETYSTSRATGVEVTNLFDSSDVNKYFDSSVNHVDYVTRNNWAGTLTFFSIEDPTYVRLQATEQLFIDEVWGQTATEEEKSDTLYPEYDRNYVENPEIDSNGNVILDKQLTVADMIGEDGEVFDTDNIWWDYLMNQISYNELAKLCRVGQRHTESAASIGLPQSFNYNESNGIANPTWVALEPGGSKQVGGYVAGKSLAKQYDDPDKNGYAELWPSNCVFTATMNRELAEKAGELWGEEGNWAGMSGLYGPGFNFYRTPYGGRNYEYFGADPYMAGMMGAQVVKGMQSQGLFAVIKHFAFNDSESVRKAANTWVPEQAAREIYLRCFEYPIVEGGALCVMGSMGRLGPMACNANKGLITGWLKNETGLKGFVTTDISFSSTKAAMLKAGTDLFDNDGTSGNDNSIDAYKEVEGETLGYGDFAWRIRDAGKRIAYTVLHSNAINGYSSNVSIKSITPEWIPLVEGIHLGSGIAIGVSFVFLAVAIFFKKKAGL